MFNGNPRLASGQEEEASRCQNIKDHKGMRVSVQLDPITVNTNREGSPPDTVPFSVAMHPDETSSKQEYIHNLPLLMGDYGIKKAPDEMLSAAGQHGISVTQNLDRLERSARCTSNIYNCNIAEGWRSR